MRSPISSQKGFQHRIVLFLLSILGGGLAVQAQDFTYDSGSDGSDGALSLTEAGTVLFNPADFDPPLDPDGDGVYHFTTITVASGVTVRMTAEIMGTKPVIWLASGTVDIEGILDLNGANGHHWNAGISQDSTAGAGGFGGGRGRRSATSVRPGNGPGGGGVAPSNGSTRYAGGGGGYVTAGGNGSSGPGGRAYGNDFLLPLWGGSGGAGGGPSSNDSAAGGGGAGGGAILIAGNVSIDVKGTIRCNGGIGGNGYSWRGGGGGSGGAIRLIAPLITGSGQLQANGGGGGNGAGGGSRGRIRIEAFESNFAGGVSPSPHFSTPGTVFLPDELLPVRIVRIGGVDVPVHPTGSFSPADVNINQAGETTLDIETRGIPVGTVVNLTMWSETGATVTVDSTPLAGTQALATATASLVIPHGFSRFFIEATWTP